IQNKFLIVLMNKTKCQACNQEWNGEMNIRKREDKYGFQHIPSELDDILLLTNTTTNTNTSSANKNNNNTNNNRNSNTSGLGLETATDAQARKELYNELYKLIFSKQKRTHGGKIAMTYEWPLLIKQLIRCRYPSDIQDYVYHKNSIKLSLDDFIHAFKT
ncbi:unnamed protein product, partial [Didymodactylos carnosus]